MLKLNVNQEKQLNFEVQIGGVQTEQVQSHLRIDIDGVEYGFPAHVGNESITVDLPPLRSVTARKLKEGEEVKVKLEIVADGHYLTPWQDTFMLSNPLVIEAKIVDDDFKPAPAFKTKLVSKGGTGDQSQGVMLEQVEEEEKDENQQIKESVSSGSLNEEEMTERLVNKLAEKLGGMFEKGKTTKVVKEEKPITSNKKEIVVKEEKQKRITKDDVANITEEGVYEYMERAGTKNPTVQKLLYEQAEVAAGSSRPVEVLRQVVKLLKSK